MIWKTDKQTFWFCVEYSEVEYLALSLGKQAKDVLKNGMNDYCQ